MLNHAVVRDLPELYFPHSKHERNYICQRVSKLFFYFRKKTSWFQIGCLFSVTFLQNDQQRRTSRKNTIVLVNTRKITRRCARELKWHLHGPESRHCALLPQASFVEWELRFGYAEYNVCVHIMDYVCLPGQLYTHLTPRCVFCYLVVLSMVVVRFYNYNFCLFIQGRRLIHGKSATE